MTEDLKALRGASERVIRVAMKLMDLEESGYQGSVTIHFSGKIQKVNISQYLPIDRLTTQGERG